MAKIRLENVTKIYDKVVRAADGVNLEIPHGKIVSLLGPSGCGKTTTMRLIAGFEEPDAGEVFIDDRNVTGLPPDQRNLSMVFQLPVVYDTMTILDNITEPLRSKGLPEGDIPKVVEEALSRVGIEKKFWHLKAKALSISDRQRLSLAHAFAVDRNAYILDEPFSNIDPKSRIILTEYVRDIQEKIGRTMIFVTHSQTEALTLSDLIAVMKDGKILQYDSPEAIYTKPMNTFVGWFLGNPGMNFINCASKKKDGKLVVDAGSFRAYEKIPAAYTQKVNTERNLILGIRPEDIMLTREEKSGYIPGVCHFAEPVGSRLLVNMELGPAVAVNVKVPLEVNAKVGEKAYIYFTENKIMLFDDQTNNAL